MSKLRVDKIAAPIVKDEFTGSVYFDGTTQNRITIPSTTDFAPGTGDFTLEMWVYHTDLTGQQTYFGDTYGNTSGIYTYKTSNNEISLYDTAQRSLSAQNVIKLNTWHHIAWTRESGVLRAFVDGVIVDEDTYTGSFTDTDYFIGDTAGTSSGEMIGYISNFRYCKLHAVYTGNFTVPTRELVAHKAPPKGVVFPTSDNITTLLACQSSTDATADATGRHTLTASSGVTAADANPGLLRRTLNLTTVTENTGSVFFDGTDDRLDIAHSTDFRIADSNTFECWINYNSLPGNNLFLGVESSYWVGYNHTGVGGASNKFVFTIYNGSSWQAVSSSTTPVVGTWYHLAAVKDGTSLKMFVNGVLENTTTMSGTAAAVTDFFNIGKWNQASAGQGVNGYLSNVRVCKGHAVYKKQFIPPTRELVVHGGPEDNRTVLLCCHDGENIFADKSGRHVIMAYGDRLSSPTPTATDSPIGITTFNPGLTRSVDATAGPTFEGGVGYNSQNWLTLPKGTTTQRGRGRGLFAGGITPTRQNIIEFVNIASTGNIQDFGDLTRALNGAGGCASATRGLFGGGYNPSVNDNTIEFVTIATTGNAVDFGDLLYAPTAPGGLSNNTRGIFAGGDAPSSVNNINFVTISTLGDAKDFGDLLKKRRQNFGSCSSPTRGLFAGGYDDTSPASRTNVIEYITIATAGNGLDFGDLNAQLSFGIAGVSSKTRGVFMGGYAAPAGVNTIQYVTIATTGDAQDFGDLTISAFARSSGVSNSERGLAAGGATPTLTNTIDYITIATTGDAKDFGDLLVARRHPGGLSDSHGGIS